MVEFIWLFCFKVYEHKYLRFEVSASSVYQLKKRKSHFLDMFIQKIYENIHKNMITDDYI